MLFNEDRHTLEGAGKAKPSGLFGIATVGSDGAPDYIEFSFADTIKLRTACDEYLQDPPEAATPRHEVPSTGHPTVPCHCVDHTVECPDRCRQGDPFFGQPFCT